MSGFWSFNLAGGGRCQAAADVNEIVEAKGPNFRVPQKGETCTCEIGKEPARLYC